MHRTIDETHLIRLSIEDQQRFVTLLLNPPALASALKRARKAHARLIALEDTHVRATSERSRFGNRSKFR